MIFHIGWQCDPDCFDSDECQDCIAAQYCGEYQAWLKDTENEERSENVS